MKYLSSLLRFLKQRTETENSSTAQAGGEPGDDVIDLRFLFRVWLRWSWVLIPCASLGLYIGYQELQNFSPKYVATMVVEPTGGGGSAALQLGSVISGLGFGVTGAGSSSGPFKRLKFVIGTVPFARKMQEEFGLLQVVYAGSWDSESGAWRVPQGEKFERQQERRRFFRQNPWSEPSIQDLASYLKGAFNFKTVPETNFVKISIRHSDPDFAVNLLEKVYFGVDSFLRSEERVEAEQRLAYVQAQMERHTFLASRNVLNNMLGQEYNNLMILDSDLPYAARIIVPQYASKRPSVPSVRSIFVTPVMLMIAAGFLLITLIAVFRRG